MAMNSMETRAVEYIFKIEIHQFHLRLNSHSLRLCQIKLARRAPIVRRDDVPQSVREERVGGPWR